MRARGDGGQLLPLYVLLVLVVCGGVLVIGRLGQLANRRAQARTAADAAALAGAVDGRVAAERLATTNGAVLEAFSVSDTDVEVRVRVGGTHATARAHRDPSTGAVVGGGDRDGLAPAMLAALARADALLGRPVPVVSGVRSRDQQQALYDARGTNPYPVAAPGTSTHERGLAIDVELAFVSVLRQVASSAGLCQPLPEADPVHFELCQPISPG